MAMTDQHRTTLRRARVYLLENLDVSSIIEHLVQTLILNTADEDNIAGKQTKRDKIKELLEILPRKGDDGYVKFMKVLQENQTFVYDKLKEINEKNAQSQQPHVSNSYQSEPSGIIGHPTDQEKPMVSESCQSKPSGIIGQPTDQENPMDMTDSRHLLAAQIMSDDTGQLVQPGYSIPRSPSSIVTNQALCSLASNLGAEWEQLAIQMGFNQSRLYQWKQDHQHNCFGQVFAMLDSWKKQNGYKATIDALISLLVNLQPAVDPSAYRHLYFEKN